MSPANTSEAKAPTAELVERPGELISLVDHMAAQFERLPEELRGMVADRMAALLVDRFYPETESAAALTQRLTVNEVLLARSQAKLTRHWLYQNAADCGAIRKGKGTRSQLLFTLAGVDSALEQRRLMPIQDGVAEQPTKPTTSAPERRRGPRRKAGDLTPNGSPRRLEVREAVRGKVR